jgi:hypothetical protein
MTYYDLSNSYSGHKPGILAGTGQNEMPKFLHTREAPISQQADKLHHRANYVNSGNVLPSAAIEVIPASCVFALSEPYDIKSYIANGPRYSL